VHSSFTRWFISQFGMAPAAWRASKGAMLNRSAVSQKE
jgi:AraC-like DNA-binding protein